MKKSEMLKEAKNLLFSAFGWNIPTTKITLLESGESGSGVNYLFFAYGRMSFMWTAIDREYLVAYPDLSGNDGMRCKLDFS